MQLAMTLERICSQERRLDTLLVVDNAPAPNMRFLLRCFAREGTAMHYLPAAENLGSAGGFASGMSRVLEFAHDEDWIVLLDDDDPPLSSAWFGELLDVAVRAFASDPMTAAIGFGGARFDRFRARLVRPAYDRRDPLTPVDHFASDPMTAAIGFSGAQFDRFRARLVRAAYDRGDPLTPVDYFASGHLPMYRVGAIRDVGTFRSLLFFGLDELEFGLRLGRAGYALYGLPPPISVLRSERRKVKPNKRRIGRRLRIEGADWRRYYSLRNLIYILRTSGRPLLALRVTLTRGLLKPIVNGLLSPRRAGAQLGLHWRASRDAWTGRMGRTLDPGPTGEDRQRVSRSSQEPRAA